MATKNNPGTAVLVALLSLVGTGALLMACQPIGTGRVPMLVDVTAVAPCPAEDGPGMTGPAPCVFDGGDASTSGYGTRWVFYSATDVCPETVQGSALVHCVIRTDWTGGVGSGEGRTN
jgi:hypothetical protein